MKKIMAVICVCALVLGAFAGCSKKDTEASSSDITPSPTPTVTETPTPEPTAEPSSEDPFAGIWYLDMTNSGAHTDIYAAFDGLRNYGGELSLADDGSVHMSVGVDYNAIGTYTVISEGQLEAKLSVTTGEITKDITLNLFTSADEAHTYLTCELDGHTIYWEK